MVIIAGKVYVASEERDRYIESNKDLIRRARSAPGCFDFVISADPLAPGRVNNFELWESAEALTAFREVVIVPADAPEIARDEVRKFQIGLVGPPF